MEKPAWEISMFEEEEEEKTRKGPWTLEEDMRLVAYISMLGAGRWSSVAKAAGLKRSGKSCRLRWVNYLRPDLKRGSITPEEERLIVDLHRKWGNRWSRIAQSLPGRTDNEIKNYWRIHIKKKPTELTPSSTWSPSLKSPPEIIPAKKTAKPSSSRNAVSFVKEQMKNSYEDSNEISFDPSASASDGSHASLSLQGPNEEFKNASTYVEAASGMVSDAAYAGDIVQDGAASSSCSMPASPVNENGGFFWDYNSLLLWNLDDDAHNMDHP